MCEGGGVVSLPAGQEDVLLFISHLSGQRIWFVPGEGFRFSSCRAEAFEVVITVIVVCFSHLLCSWRSNQHLFKAWAWFLAECWTCLTSEALKQNISSSVIKDAPTVSDNTRWNYKIVVTDYHDCKDSFVPKFNVNFGLKCVVLAYIKSQKKTTSWESKTCVYLTHESQVKQVAFRRRNAAPECRAEAVIPSREETGKTTVSGLFSESVISSSHQNFSGWSLAACWPRGDSHEDPLSSFPFRQRQHFFPPRRKHAVWPQHPEGLASVQDRGHRPLKTDSRRCKSVRTWQRQRRSSETDDWAALVKLAHGCEGRWRLCVFEECDFAHVGYLTS